MRALCLSAIFLFMQTVAAEVLTLERYLEQVKAQSPEARALISAVSAAELRLDEAEVSLGPEGYAEYHRLAAHVTKRNVLMRVIIGRT